MERTTFSVDTFKADLRKTCTAFFLTHFHSDHYKGVTNKYAPIYCSEITARLLILKLKIKKENIQTFKLNDPINVQGTTVTAIDACHCPGSVCLVFELPNGFRILHTGDCRASERFLSQPLLKTKFDVVYLDGTYWNSKLDFPSQEKVVAETLKKVKRIIKERESVIPMPTLIVCGSYGIGKEKLYVELARKLKLKVHAPPLRIKMIEAVSGIDLSQKEETTAASTEISSEEQVLPAKNSSLFCLSLSKIQEKTLSSSVVSEKTTESKKSEFIFSESNYASLNTTICITKKEEERLAKKPALTKKEKKKKAGEMAGTIINTLLDELKNSSEDEQLESTKTTSGSVNNQTSKVLASNLQDPLDEIRFQDLEFVDDIRKAGMTIVTMYELNKTKLSSLLEQSNVSRIIAIEPTGWTKDGTTIHHYAKNGKIIRKNAIHVIRVSYSEHSSYSELRSFLDTVSYEILVLCHGNNNEQRLTRLSVRKLCNADDSKIEKYTENS